MNDHSVSHHAPCLASDRVLPLIPASPSDSSIQQRIHDLGDRVSTLSKLADKISKHSGQSNETISVERIVRGRERTVYSVSTEASTVSVGLWTQPESAVEPKSMVSKPMVPEEENPWEDMLDWSVPDRHWKPRHKTGSRTHSRGHTCGLTVVTDRQLGKMAGLCNRDKAVLDSHLAEERDLRRYNDAELDAAERMERFREREELALKKVRHDAPSTADRWRWASKIEECAAATLYSRGASFADQLNMEYDEAMERRYPYLDQLMKKRVAAAERRARNAYPFCEACDNRSCTCDEVSLDGSQHQDEHLVEAPLTLMTEPEAQAMVTRPRTEQLCPGCDRNQRQCICWDEPREYDASDDDFLEYGDGPLTDREATAWYILVLCGFKSRIYTYPTYTDPDPARNRLPDGRELARRDKIKAPLRVRSPYKARRWDRLFEARTTAHLKSSPLV